jgi:predicted DNA-binding transcriptional regulator AlpA
MTAKKLVGRKEIMQWLGWSGATLWRKIKDGTIPQPIRMPGCHPRWVLSELEEALLATKTEVGDSLES